MSTKQQTDSKTSNNTAFNFDPASMQTYLKNISTVMPFLQNNVTNPFGSDAFKQESTIGQDQAAKMGQRGVSNVAQNAAGLGYNTNGGMFNAMLQRAGQNTNMMQGQAFRGSIGNAIGRQMTSAGMLSSFQPLMTGSNSAGTSQQTQTTSGLGTWLPQLAGALGGAAISAFAPGLGAASAAGGTASAGGGGFMGGMGFNGVTGGFPGMNSGGMGGLNSLFPQGSMGGIPQFGGSSAYNYGAAGRG